MFVYQTRFGAAAADDTYTSRRGKHLLWLAVTAVNRNLITIGFHRTARNPKAVHPSDEHLSWASVRRLSTALIPPPESFTVVSSCQKIRSTKQDGLDEKGPVGGPLR